MTAPTKKYCDIPASVFGLKKNLWAFEKIFCKMKNIKNWNYYRYWKCKIITQIKCIKLWVSIGGTHDA